MKLMFSVAFLVLSAAALVSAQWRRNGYSVQQRTFQNQYPGQSSPAVVEADWVCKNQKTGDMIVLIPDNGPGSNGQGQWQQQRPPTGQPGYPTYPQPTYPSSKPTFPAYPTQPTYPSNPGTAPNTNGDGLIDIRLRNY